MDRESRIRVGVYRLVVACKGEIIPFIPRAVSVASVTETPFHIIVGVRNATVAVVRVLIIVPAPPENPNATKTFDLTPTNRTIDPARAVPTGRGKGAVDASAAQCNCLAHGSREPSFKGALIASQIWVKRVETRRRGQVRGVSGRSGDEGR
jgi:hypothetical protein